MSPNSKRGKDHTPPNPKKDGTDDKSTKRHVYVEPGVKIDLTDDFKKEYRTNESDNTTHNQKQLFWARVSVFLILVYAIVTLLIYHANKKAADAAKTSSDTSIRQLKDFEQAEGAHISIGMPRGDIRTNEISMEVANYGHVPSPRTWFYPQIHRFIENGTQMPASVYQKDFEFGGDQTEIPPGDGQYGFTLPLEIGPSEMNALQAGTEKMWVSVSFKYENGFGSTSDMKGVCFSYNRKRPLAWDTCPVYDFAHLPKPKP